MPTLTRRNFESVPQIDGSRWGFIALIIAIFVVLVLLLCIIICLCRKNRSIKKMSSSSKMDHLTTSHPAPVASSRPRPPEPIIKPTPAPQAQYLLEEEDDGHHTPYAAAVAADKHHHGASTPQMQQLNPGDYGYHSTHLGQQQQQPYESYDYQGNPTHNTQFDPQINSQYGHNQRAGDYAYNNNNQYLPPGAAQPQFSHDPRFQSPTPPSSGGMASPGGYAMPTPFAPSHHQQEHPGSYPQDSYAASSSHPMVASPNGGYEEGYSPYAAANEEPLAYPHGAQHTHDEAKTSLGPSNP